MNKPIERIIERPVQPGMVGDGFRVYNYIPQGVTQQRMSPFLMLDFNPEYNFGPSEKPRGVDVHPHKGFETVTIAYQGSVAHTDSSGNSGIIYPGDVQWMTAGSGILHKEFHEEEFSRKGGNFEMVQLWVNLPKKFKNEYPHYQAIAAKEMGKIDLENNQGVINIIAGELNGVKGPATTYSPVILADIKLKDKGVFKTSVDAGFNTALLLVKGKAIINGQEEDEHSFVLLDNTGTDINVISNGDSSILLMSGEPINEPIASYGPFVMNTKDEIYDAITEYQQGKFGVL